MKSLLLALSILISGCTVVEDSPSTSTSVTTLVSTSTSTSTGTSVQTTPVYKAPTAAELKGCPKVGEYQAFDRVGYSSKRFVEIMHHLGMRTALRYYDWVGNESLSGKIPSDAELALYKQYDFDLAMVFQHNSRPLSVFADEARRKKDPVEILKLATKWKQPKGSAIYVGVDHDHASEADKSVVAAYFAAVSKPLRAAGYRVGMYGSGGVCLKLAKNGVIDKSKDGKPLCWIAASSYGWSGTLDIIKTGNYVIHQKVNQNCAGVSMDFDKLLAKDIGQWRFQ